MSKAVVQDLPIPGRQTATSVQSAEYQNDFEELEVGNAIVYSDDDDGWYESKRGEKSAPQHRAFNALSTYKKNNGEKKFTSKQMTDGTFVVWRTE